MVNNSIITNNGKNILLRRGYTEGSGISQPLYFKVGRGQADVTVNDTDLTTPVPFYGVDTIDSCEATGWTLSGDALAETVNSNSGQYKEGAACLNLGKTATTTTLVGYSKFEAVFDFTAKECYIWFYINDTTSLDITKAVRFIFGTDETNCYYTDYARSGLSNGWNYLKITQTTSSILGTPLVTSCSFIALEIYTITAVTTITAGNIRMDFVHLATSDDYLKTFNATYPSFNEINKEVTIRCTLEAAEAPGQLINGFGLFNNDSTKKLHSIDKFTAVSKGAADVISFIVVDRIL